MKSPWGTLLLALINTIQGDSIVDVVVQTGFRNFYLVLEREFGLEFGRIILAMASPAELKAVIDRDWPYIDSYRDSVDACLQREDCAGISDAIGKLTTAQISGTLSPHLLKSDVGLPPFSLIPFCAYQDQLDILGQNVSHFPSMPVCSHSKPTIVDGTVCHTISPKGLKTKQTEEFGVVIILDSNPVTMDLDFVQNHVPAGKDTWQSSWKLNKLDSRNEAEVYFPNLNRFRGSSQGRFSLTGLKIMTATDKFLDRRGSSGSCSVRSYDECHQEAYIDRVTNDCGCTPFSLSLAPFQKVNP